ncbi:PQQ-binding-like beta-propeller repeat protein [Rubripirellula reticaptiva]|uniref:Outer membrane biogenesis protein BamB n=1 Tax=Rubripirellula reticaptiva TaxID=2528013 RepID=A0A5C6FA70_9BACT|nr:PQQ-binding-like beta-propeller repeat protein [Rubripirellula reticaptiva]TWU57430.1 outer membrane biogenesis protein BamB [Rubripirellula reticaptiva]
MKLRHAPLSLLVCLLGLSVHLGLSPCSAGDTDWPQWRGPNRDGHAAKQDLMKSWPAEGPEIKWQAENLGRGYSTAAVVDGRLYTLGADATDCFAICLDAATGESVWKTNVSRASNGDDYNHGWGGGPRSTPTIDGDQVFVLSDIGTLASLERTTGKVQWQVDIVQSFGGKIPMWGYSESLLVDGDRVVVTPGESNFMVALDRKDGSKVWQSKGSDAPAHYVSPIKGSVGETSFYVTASKPGLLAFDCKSGDLVFSDGSTGNGVAVIPTPIISGNSLYHTSDYGSGNTLLSLTHSGKSQSGAGEGGAGEGSAGQGSAGQGGVDVTTVYHLSGKTMQNHHGGVVLVDGVIYGFTKANGGVWMAQDLATGETLWEEKTGRDGSGSIAYADGRLYCYYDKDGSLFLVDPNRKGWTLAGQLKLPQQTNLPRDKGAIWAHPIIADGMLIIRDQDLMFAYNIAE